MNLPSPILVADQESLTLCVEQCLRADAVAVDTEFVRTDTFYPILGLIQICDGDNVWLIDPLPIDDFGELEDLFSCPDVVKVFHSCSEDLEVLRHQLGLVPAPLFDTQIGAAFLNYGYSRGYGVIVKAVLDVALDQHETRSDWLRRPLSDSQLTYAAEDVYYLIRVYHKLAAELARTERSAWVGEEMAELLAQARAPESLETYYLKVKGANKLSLRETAVLRELTRWREKEARVRNKPRNRIVADKSLLDLLQLRPRQLNALYSIEGINTGIVRRYGDKLLEILHSDPEMTDIEAIPEALDKRGKTVLSQCREVLDAKAQELGLAVELLAKKKDLEQLVRTVLDGRPALPDRLIKSWRYGEIGQDLLTAVAPREPIDV